MATKSTDDHTITLVKLWYCSVIPSLDWDLLTAVPIAAIDSPDAKPWIMVVLEVDDGHKGYWITNGVIVYSVDHSTKFCRPLVEANDFTPHLLGLSIEQFADKLIELVWEHIDRAEVWHPLIPMLSTNI